MGKEILGLALPSAFDTGYTSRGAVVGEFVVNDGYANRQHNLECDVDARDGARLEGSRRLGLGD